MTLGEALADPGRLVSLLLYLPDDAALRREMDPAPVWPTEHELLALIAERVDLVAEVGHMHAGMYLQAHTKHPPSWPKWNRLDIPRPGRPKEPPAKSSGMSPREFVQMFRPKGGDE